MVWKQYPEGVAFFKCGFIRVPKNPLREFPQAVDSIHWKMGDSGVLFEYFCPEQKSKVCSLIVYKHVFMQEIDPFPAVVLLVSSAANHFRVEDEEQVKTFLAEMLTRIEMEYIVLELTQRLALSGHTVPNEPRASETGIEGPSN